VKGQQLALGVQLRDTARFDTFFPGSNAEVIGALRAYLDAPAGNGLLLFGAPGLGKTHLLQALVREAAARRLTVAYLPLREPGASDAEALSGLEMQSLVCLDDIDIALPNAGWSLALLRLVDALRAGRRHFLLSARSAPERLQIQRSDLSTRLTACTLLGLKPLKDADRGELLRSRAQARGLELPAEALRWLLTHLPRDTGSLVAALDRLDHASLAAQRKLTLPFVQMAVQPLLPSRAAAQTEPG
jgi:DnaA family protein